MTRLALSLTVPLMILSAAGPALAQSTGSEALDAYSAIIEASNTASTCGFLSSDEQAELKHYAALGEIAAAKATSVEQMQSARAEALSRRPRCSASDEQSVRFVMDEVRIAAGGGESGSRRQAAQQPPVSRGFAAPAPVAPPPAAMPETVSLPPVNMRDPVARYGGQARAYFLERKCNYLPYNTELDFWNLLTARYKQMVATHGRSRVNAAQKAGEAAASTIACGREARAAVTDGYRDLGVVSAQ
ncbi:hypothetical protein FHS85_001660 [Rhodoligotrophos appendicifer]|uniref:hypothetical protein n=1 Tax=Rhodoligotrophos appendicifer TaxID=987056 RepID=UPI001186056D|nr:hypothetical protein [Rhodoligotrophos appendicifer]